MADIAPDAITAADIVPPPPTAGPDGTSPATTHHIPSHATLKYIPSWLLLYITKTDATLSQLNRVLKTSSGTDASLQLLSYSLTLLISILSASPQQHKPQKTTARPSPPSSRATDGRPPPRIAPSSPPSLSSLTTRLLAFKTLLGDVRMFLRLWGLVSIYVWAASVYKSPPKDRLLKGIAWLQVGATTGFQVLENAAFLTKHGVLRLGKKTQGACWLWSSRMWAAHVALDFVRLWRVSRLAEARRRSGVGEKGEREEVREREDWWRAFVTNAAFTPLLWHYSLEKGALDESTIGACGSVAGVLAVREAWNKAAPK
ncbi:MAG: hypothetical protein M1829_006481 [Trizodia sp. TS-e1964]|nr:MAG: hypothetical protein M1829_006481 [Trizodia sp. TS-e1964]